MILVSSCLVGLSCRYDGSDNKDEKVLEYISDKVWMPICPEQMGGLETPREPAEIVQNKVLTKTGRDLTGPFVKGADEAARLALLAGAQEAILKARSPSCGCTQVYDGTFSGKLVDGDGLTAKALKKMGLTVRSEQDL